MLQKRPKQRERNLEYQTWQHKPVAIFSSNSAHHRSLQQVSHPDPCAPPAQQIDQKALSSVETTVLLKPKLVDVIRDPKTQGHGTV